MENPVEFQALDFFGAVISSVTIESLSAPSIGANLRIPEGVKAMRAGPDAAGKPAAGYKDSVAFTCPRNVGRNHTILLGTERRAMKTRSEFNFFWS